MILKCKPQGEEDEVVHTKTLDERSKGWARGSILWKNFRLAPWSVVGLA